MRTSPAGIGPFCALFNPHLAPMHTVIFPPAEWPLEFYIKNQKDAATALGGSVGYPGSYQMRFIYWPGQGLSQNAHLHGSLT